MDSHDTPETALSIEALFDDRGMPRRSEDFDAEAVVAAANVIVAVDRMTGEHKLFHGINAIDDAIERHSVDDVRKLWVEVDLDDAEDWIRLGALIALVHGRCDCCPDLGKD